MFKLRKPVRLLLGVVCTLAFFSGVVRGESFLVKDGKANAEIVIAKKAPRTVTVASWELRNYLRKITGATLPIVSKPTGKALVKIFIGESDFTRKLGITAKGLEAGAYRIVSGDDWLVLIGTDTDFQPVEPYTRSRKQRGSKKLLDAWDKISGSKWGLPSGNAFKRRLKGINKLYGEKGGPEYLWTFDERGSYNAVCGFLRTLGVRWYMPGELGEVVPQHASIALPKVDQRVIPAFPVRDSSIGIGVHDKRLAIWAMRLGMRQPHGFGWAHGLNSVTAREEMKRDHPDYYALYAGKRDTAFRSGGRQCLSSPGLFNETVKYARTMFDHYNYQGISVQPADGYTIMCQCKQCVGKDSPERLYRGRMSDYVWDFTVRVANETAKTHPDRMIGNLAYNLFRLPPVKIDKLPDNVRVSITGARRPNAVAPERRKEIRQLREAWERKTDVKMANFENYPLTARGFWLPAFTAHTNAKSINAIKGTFIGENIQQDSHKFMEAMAFNSYQFYFTFRMYWGDKNQDIDPMLEEFYTLFYGPARAQMKAFFDYCEANWTAMPKDKSKADRALALFAEARKQAKKGSIYDQRLAVMGEYMSNLAERSKQLAREQKREGVRAIQMWRGAEGGKSRSKPVKLDGRLDDEFWKKMPGGRGGRLRDLKTGGKPANKTTFQVAWGRDAIYFAIRCYEKDGKPVDGGAKGNDDPAIWVGDCVEILLETEKNSYYQIAISPTGIVTDMNRANGQKTFRWNSQAEVKTHIADDSWTIEARIPVIEKSNDPFHQVIGRRPLKSLPWYFNVCRQRPRAKGSELSAFSPTGKKGFHVPNKFAMLYYKDLRKKKK
jgi:Domain of unknown function (DUF4838)/Carbohydrate family 9 binding domain-like